MAGKRQAQARRERAQRAIMTQSVAQDTAKSKTRLQQAVASTPPPLTRTKTATKKVAKPKLKQGSMDVTFFLLVLVLVAFGLVMVFSASYAAALHESGDSFYYIAKQVKFAILGLAAMLLISRIPYFLYKNSVGIIYTVGIILMALVVITNKGEAGRWLSLGDLTFQPSEIMKLAVIIAFAALIAQNYNKMDTFQYGVKPFLIAIVPVIGILIIFQHHLSATLIICAIGVIMMYIGGTRMKYFLVTIPAAIIAIVGVILAKGVGYMGERIQIWLDPFSDPLGTTWQTMQSMIAIGSGGIMGLGLGNSRQKYMYLPEPQNDFIFAIVCEELGLIGAILVILLFIFLVYRGFVIANKAPNKFASMLVIGIMLQIAIQTMLNIAVVTNSIPNTGISLPFFSYGGTALVIQMAEMGIVLNISRFSSIDKPTDT